MTLEVYRARVGRVERFSNLASTVDYLRRPRLLSSCGDGVTVPAFGSQPLALHSLHQELDVVFVRHKQVTALFDTTVSNASASVMHIETM